MKKTAAVLLMSLGLFPVLFSSCSSVGSTAGNRGGASYVQATAGSGGVQWTGGNNFSSDPSTPVLFSSRSGVGSTAGHNGGVSYVKATAGSNGVQWTGGNNSSGEPSTD